MSSTDEFKAGNQPDFSSVRVGFEYSAKSGTATFTFAGVPMADSEPFFRWLGTTSGLNTVGATILMGMVQQGVLPPELIAETMKVIGEVTEGTS
ncbi:Uncharacterised protein [Mycobacteroides abscessus subsp. massiliense]|nr:hypothetical protein [Mycobacteroides abscessus]SKM19064.1 Uncharacterised protein [Mycobacteroides abscessus subsp. massiliense]MDM2426874.1 hypothetical protein [Mycobacteroides abscessus]MDM2431796.1 hypothetical protein [Mycobacteroides abscessus]MDM2436592.1 hypothetical protein [Mycobacteroides abscessus]